MVSDSKKDFWDSSDVHWLSKYKPFNFLCLTSDSSFIIYIWLLDDLWNSPVITMNSSWSSDFAVPFDVRQKKNVILCFVPAYSYLCRQNEAESHHISIYCLS